jgi:hypothetical protein
MENDYRIEFSTSAERVYQKLYEEAQASIENSDDDDIKVALFETADDLIYNVIASDPFNPQWALPGRLSHFYRVMRGVLCIVYVGVPEFSQICIIAIQRKNHQDYHSKDSYAALIRMIRSGKADQFFKLMGMQTPPPSIPSVRSTQPYRGQ